MLSHPKRLKIEQSETLTVRKVQNQHERCDFLKGQNYKFLRYLQADTLKENL